VPIEDTFHQLLALDDNWRVITATYEEPQNRFVIQVEETAQLWKSETKRVGFEVSCYDHVEALEWRHLNVFNKEAVIICRLPRGRYWDPRVADQDGWGRRYSGGGVYDVRNATGGHYDHVHVTVYGSSGTA
jgi:hypothetical protein